MGEKRVTGRTSGEILDAFELSSEFQSSGTAKGDGQLSAANRTLCQAFLRYAKRKGWMNNPQVV